MKRMLLGLMALVALALPLAALGQAKSNKVAPKSFTNPGGVKKKTGNAVPVTETALVDAVLADSLLTLGEIADEHFHQGEYFHIVNLNRIIVQGDPGNVEAYANIGYLLWSKSVDEKDPKRKAALSKDSHDALQQGIQSNPKNFYLYDEMGQFHWIYFKNPKAAIPYYEMAAKYNPPAATLHMLANCYERTNQWTKAAQIWARAAKSPSNPQQSLAVNRLKRAKDRLAAMRNRVQ